MQPTLRFECIVGGKRDDDENVMEEPTTFQMPPSWANADESLPVAEFCETPTIVVVNPEENYGTNRTIMAHCRDSLKRRYGGQRASGLGLDFQKSTVVSLIYQGAHRAHHQVEELQSKAKDLSMRSSRHS